MRLAGAGLDPAPPLVAFSPGGDGAVAGAFVNLDTATASGAFLAPLGSRSSGLGDRRDPLDLAWAGGGFAVLAGTSGGGRVCCRTTEVLARGRHGYAPVATLVRGLTGATVGRLIAVGRGTLAAVASAQGVWVAQARSGLRFGGARRLTATSASPASLVAAATRGGRTLVAWIAGTLVPSIYAPPERIVISAGTSTRAPGGLRTLLTLPAGDMASQLAIAAAPATPTLVWVEDGFDAAGDFRAEVVATDVTAAPREHLFPQTGTVSGLAAAADGAGSEVLAWKVCDPAPACQAVATTRPAGGHFGAPVTLGAIDAASEPAVAAGVRAGVTVGWVSDGVALARRSSARGLFGPPHSFPGSGNAANLTLAASSSGRVVAAWSDGAARTSILAATYSPR